MQRTALPALIVLVLIAGPGQAAELRVQPAGHLDWHRQIKTDQGENAVAFQQFMEIDWARLARSHFKAYPLADLSKAQIEELAAKGFFGQTSVDFLALRPAAYRTTRFLSLSAEGSRRLEVKALKGTVRYAFDRPMTSVLRVAVYGSVIGVPVPNDVAAGGFVVMLADGQELAGAEVVARNLPQLEAVNSFGELKIARQVRYRFQGTGASYLFVQFEADTACDYGCCEFTYLLFREDPKAGALTQLQSSRYSCDV